MSIHSNYNERMSRFVSAFCQSSTQCVVDCSCGRVHFVSHSGHGDYRAGELEQLQEMASTPVLARDDGNKKEYIEHVNFDSIDILHIDGQVLVPDCPCGKSAKYAAFIEENAERLANHLKAFFIARRKKLTEKLQTTDQHLIELAEARKP